MLAMKAIVQDMKICFNSGYQHVQLQMETEGRSLHEGQRDGFQLLRLRGGSSMGYKLAGFDVVGCDEIDKRMADNREAVNLNKSKRVVDAFSCFTNALFAGGVFGSAIEKAEKEIEEVEKIAYQE